MIELDQLWYTWSRDGLGSMTGFRVRAASEGLHDIRGIRNQHIHRFLNYHLPAGVSPFEFKSRIAPPISLSFIDNVYYNGYHFLDGRPERLLIRKVYTGLDDVGRPGVFFAHVIAGLPDNFTAHDAIRLWHCPKLWAESDQGISARDTHLPTIPYSEIEAYVKQSQHTFDFAAIIEKLTSILQYILVQGLPRPLVVYGQSDSIAALIYCITHCIPPTTLKRLSFTTYESESRDIEVTILGTTNAKEIASGTLLHVTLPALNKPVPENIQRYTQDTINTLIHNGPVMNFEEPPSLEHSREADPVTPRKKEPDFDPPTVKNRKSGPLPGNMLTLDSATGYPMINFLHWLANNYGLPHCQDKNEPEIRVNSAIQRTW